mmetsp:Transcript_26749/g.67291  ORF Transcript_26749/g.67291 Transcript_26749/m.67291 type:complete len:218 (-) Transcript_26749:366-1019(-)
MYAYMEAPLRACASSHRKRSSHMAPTRAEKPRGSGGREAGRPVREAPTAGQRRSPLPLLATAVAVLLLLSGPRALAYEDEDEHAVALREAWRHSLPCADCLAISAALLEDMRAAYPHGTQGGEGGEEETLIMGRGPGRRMIHVWSELEINAVLDAACDNNRERLAGRLELCHRVVAAWRDPIENHAFSQGPEGLQELLCADWTGACPMHEVGAEGEL